VELDYSEADVADLPSGHKDIKRMHNAKYNTEKEEDEDEAQVSYIDEEKEGEKEEMEREDNDGLEDKDAIDDEEAEPDAEVVVAWKDKNLLDWVLELSDRCQ
jgi:hypothetical protein